MRFPRSWKFLVASLLFIVFIGAAVDVFGLRWRIPQSLLANSIYLASKKQTSLSFIALRLSRFLADDAPTHFLLGQHLKTIKQYDAVAEEFRRALKRDPFYPHAHYEIGKLYFIGGVKPDEYEKAIAEFSREIALTNYPHAYHLRGILYGAQQRWQEAESDFRTEMSLWSSWGAPLNLAWILFAEGRLEEAEQAMQRVKELAPGSIWARNGLGVIYLNQGKLQAAIIELERAFEKAGTLTVEEYRAAYSGNEDDDPKVAIQNIRAGIAFNTALAHERLKNFSQAVKWYKTAESLLRGAPNNYVAGSINPETIQKKLEELKKYE